MARRKKMIDETPQQSNERHMFEAISNHATRSEKVSWNRMMDNMVSLLAKIRPVEDKILNLQAEKIKMFDDVSNLRRKMVAECVHPYEQLIEKQNGTVQCKFCNREFTIRQSYLNQTTQQ